MVGESVWLAWTGRLPVEGRELGVGTGRRGWGWTAGWDDGYEKKKKRLAGGKEERSGVVVAAVVVVVVVSVGGIVDGIGDVDGDGEEAARHSTVKGCRARAQKDSDDRGNGDASGSSSSRARIFPFLVFT